MSNIRILAVGDVVGKPGTEFFKKTFPAYKKYAGIDLCIVNGENSAPGNGTTPDSAEDLLAYGADIITGGNHTFRRREFYDYLDRRGGMCVRPANYGAAAPGVGWRVIHTAKFNACVINILGTVYMDNLDNPFRCVDNILKEPEAAQCPVRIVDFHAEATSEKQAMGYYLDSRVSAVFGTHTHIQTADERVLPGGTGYITDLGMTGPVDSVLGVNKDEVLSMFLTHMPVRFSNPDSPCVLCGCIFDVDAATGKCLSVQRVKLER